MYLPEPFSPEGKFALKRTVLLEFLLDFCYGEPLEQRISVIVGEIDFAGIGRGIPIAFIIYFHASGYLTGDGRGRFCGAPAYRSAALFQ